MRIQVSTNLKNVRETISKIGPQAQYAAAVALTRTAKEVRNELKKEMSRVFDRPTPYTMNSLYVKPATKQNLEAMVWLKDATSKGTPADRYLKPQIVGGSRSLKSMEKALQSSGKMPRGYFAQPAAGAQLDQYGNVKRSQIVQILSQLQVQRGGGYDSKRSNSAASRRTVARQGVTYFALTKPVGRLVPGIYVKRQFAKGSAIKPVFIFTHAATYQPRFKFFEIAEQVAQRSMPSIFDQALREALQSAIPKYQQNLF